MLVLPLALAAAGCTAISLERETISQVQSAADFRYEATLHALAMVADDPGTVPSYSLLSSGTTAVTDTGMVNPATTWAAWIFKSESIGITGTHVPQLTWTVSTAADHTQLEAMRAACRWVLEGQDESALACLPILRDPEEFYSSPVSVDPADEAPPPPHFGVACRLARLPKGWLHSGRCCDVPPCACYTAHCGNTSVWVMPDGAAGLAGFTLVLQDIATLNVAPSDLSRPENITPLVPITLWVWENPLPVVKFNIKAVHGKFSYERDPVTPEPKKLLIDQPVLWCNNTNTACDVGVKAALGNNAHGTSVVLEIDNIAPGSSKAAAFSADDAKTLTKDATQGSTIKVSVDIRPHNDDTPGSFTLATETIEMDTAFSPYSQQLVFRVDRVIRPEHRCDVENALRGAIAKNKAIEIPWDRWIAWTAPYPGNRTSAKPGAPMVSRGAPPTPGAPGAPNPASQPRHIYRELPNPPVPPFGGTPD
jgi:hypothetical protein